MKNTDLKEKRDADLYAAYVKALESGMLTSIVQAAELIRLQPAPRFYISSMEAAKHISRIQSGISLINLNSLSRKRVWKIYDRYLEYLGDHPGCTLSRERIVEMIVEEPAPEWYISAEAVRKILRKEQRKRRNRWSGGA